MHINDSNWDVAHLTMDDFDMDIIGSQDATIRSKAIQYMSIFLAECHIAEIAADVLKEF